MLRSSFVEETHCPMMNRERREQEWQRELRGWLECIFFCFRVSIWQQPGVIAFSRLGIGDILQVNLQLISDSLSAPWIQLPATNKEGMSYHGTWGNLIRRLVAKEREIA